MQREKCTARDALRHHPQRRSVRDIRVLNGADDRLDQYAREALARCRSSRPSKMEYR